MKRRSGWCRSGGYGALCALLALSAACGDDAETDGEGGSGAGTGGEDGSGASTSEGGGSDGGGTTTDGGGPSTGGSSGEGGAPSSLPTGELSLWSSTTLLPADSSHPSYECVFAFGSRLYAFSEPVYTGGDFKIRAAVAEAQGESLSNWTLLPTLDFATSQPIIHGCTAVGDKVLLLLEHGSSDWHYVFATPSPDGTSLTWSTVVPMVEAAGNVVHYDGDLLGIGGATGLRVGHVGAEDTITWTGTSSSPGATRMFSTPEGRIYATGTSTTVPTLFQSDFSMLERGLEWVESPPLPRVIGCPVIVDDTLYAIGTTAMFAQLGSNGVETQWTFTNAPPQTVSACVEVDGYIYALAGGNQSGTFAYGNVYVAQIL